MGTDNFCLRWNDFEANISASLKELRDDRDFFDVTLACEDDQVQAHKVILSACSPFFKNILRRHPHQHPLLYLRGIKMKELSSIINFMYHGEANVDQANLNLFLSISEELKVKGLTQHRDTSPVLSNNRRHQQQHPQQHQQHDTAPSPPKPGQNHERPDVASIKAEPRHASSVFAMETATALCEENYDEYTQYEEDSYNMDPAAMGPGNKGGYIKYTNTKKQFDNFFRISERYAELQEFIKQNCGPGHTCLICGKMCNKLHAVQYHIESAHGKHFNVTYQCEICNKTVDTKNAFITHKSRHHKKGAVNLTQYMAMC